MVGDFPALKVGGRNSEMLKMAGLTESSSPWSITSHKLFISNKQRNKKHNNSSSSISISISISIIMGKKKKEMIRLERESVIPISKQKLITTLAHLIEDKCERAEFEKLSMRVDYTIRAWYNLQFDRLMQLYSLFDPIHGANKLQQHNLSPQEIDNLELDFINHLFQVMDKSNFKLTTDDEITIALSGQYRLNLPIIVDESKLDTRLLRTFFTKHPHPNLPIFADKEINSKHFQFIIFRRGIGIDQMSAYFINAKINTILLRFWKSLLKLTGLKRVFYKKNVSNQNELKQINVEGEQDHDIHVERIRIEKMRLNISNLVGRITIQEPTFDRMIVLYRRISRKDKFGRGIFVKHFKHIPMADLEIVLPEKKNPSLTPMDWVKFLVSAAIGLVTVLGSLAKTKADFRVISAILFALCSYCVKTYFTFQNNLSTYQNLITRSVYDKQLDSGRGTLLHLCDEVIQQEVKEVILSYFVLMEQGQVTRKELDLRCEGLIKEEFDECCNFDVDDAVEKLEKLGIVSQDSGGKYSCVSLQEATDVIGTTTEEVVLKANNDYNTEEAAETEAEANNDVKKERDSSEFKLLDELQAEEALLHYQFS